MEARVLRGHGPNVWVDLFTLDAPHDQRRPIIPRTWGGDHHAEQLERAGTVLTADELRRLP